MQITADLHVRPSLKPRWSKKVSALSDLKKYTMLDFSQSL
jgi:hypothetical protein